MKRRTLARLRLHPDFSAVALDDLFANRQTNAGARIFVARVQALEDLKYPLPILRIDADPVVF
jgi:hypothetical protein